VFCIREVQGVHTCLMKMSTALVFVYIPCHVEVRFGLQKAGFLNTAVARKTSEFVCLKLASVAYNCAI
jgi:hypothetical protein